MVWCGVGGGRSVTRSGWSVRVSVWGGELRGPSVLQGLQGLQGLFSNFQQRLGKKKNSDSSAFFFMERGEECNPSTRTLQTLHPRSQPSRKGRVRRGTRQNKGRWVGVRVVGPRLGRGGWSTVRASVRERMVWGGSSTCRVCRGIRLFFKLPAALRKK